MKRWKSILVVAGATAVMASASLAAISVAAAPATDSTTDPGTPPAQTAFCDHHMPAMNQMHDAMGGGMMGGVGSHVSMDSMHGEFAR